jgi:hypothetical protein
MNKKLKILISVVVAVAVLLVGGVAFTLSHFNTAAAASATTSEGCPNMNSANCQNMQAGCCANCPMKSGGCPMMSGK